MKRLIKNNNIILDGTATRYEKEQEAFEKLSLVEELMERYGVNDLHDMENCLKTAKNVVNSYLGIEKQLGINIPKLFELLKTDHIRTQDGELVCDGIQYNQKLKSWCVVGHNVNLDEFFRILKLKSHRKEWWLPKEEIEIKK